MNEVSLAITPGFTSLVAALESIVADVAADLGDLAPRRMAAE